MSVIHNDLLLATDEATGYNLTKSLRLRASASAYLSRTPASSSNRKTFTWSGWVKLGKSGINSSFFEGRSGTNLQTTLSFGSDDKIFVQHYNTSSGINIVWQSSAVYRDPAAWYHIVFVVDTTQASSASGVKLYVNGVQQSLTFTSYGGSYSQNMDTFVNLNTATHYIGMREANTSQTFDGYMTDVNFIDGQALTPTSFGETDAITGVWKPKAYTGTYGTNGFYLPFTDVATTSGSNAGLGKDFSGNGNYWTTNNISVTSGSTYDSMTDVPTLTSATAANYAVANPLAKQSDVVVSDGNLKISLGSVTGGIRKTNASIALPTTGKYYWESKNVGTTNTNFFCGIQALTASLSVSATGDIFYNEAGEIQNNGSATTGFGAITANDILGMAYDADANKIYFYKNNTIQNSSGTTPSFSGPYTPFFGMYLTNNAQEINFGQRPFSYTPPTGYKALNTYNLPDSTIVAGNTVMDATVYAGDGTSPKSQTNAAGFKPDLVWIKDRTTAYSHNIYDSVRGFGLTHALQSDNTNSETTNATNTALYGYLSGFNSNGFSTTNGSDPSSPSIWVNASSQNYVAWQWQAGQGTTSSNTSGSITSTVSVNASAGFSIVSWTGTGANATVGHGLGVAPKFFITKNIAVGTTDWLVYHASLGATNYVRLNLTNASAASSITFNNTAPTSSVFSVGTWDTANGNGNAMVTYCWAEIPGFSKAFSYTGNGSTDGAFVYCGFRPKFILIKRTNGASYWILFDSVRNSYNLVDMSLFPNTSDAEFQNLSNSQPVDLLSNGFKLRGTGNGGNGTGDSYVGIAFAESPFKNSLAR